MYLQLKRPHNTLTQFAVIVCLFAVLIIYFGPLFSQISNALTQANTTAISTPIENPATENMAMGDMAMAGHDHSTMLHHDSMENSSQAPSHDSHHGHHAEGESINVMEACGYCSLLFHLSWLDVKSFEFVPLIQGRYPNVATTTISRKCHLPFLSINPRAPPIQTA